MANPSPELVKQVAEELKEIQNAPPIMYGPSVPRCHFCGAIETSHENLELVETVDGNQRHRGGCCGGNAGGIKE
jgi:creatinine amidohydrolase/Fe(II)-dependent formamide hydrolase-like protein